MNEFRNLKVGLRNYTGALLHLLYPERCAACGVLLPDGISEVCPICSSDFVYTYFEGYHEPSALDQLFYGRVPVESTFALLYFSKAGSTQELVHAIKYKNNRQLALFLGKRMGERLQVKWPESTQRPDVLVPIPLHPRKKHLRGYNQSALLAEGMSLSIGIPWNEQVLKRRVNTATQTRKGKYERWDNVEEIFELFQPERWKNKHICIVDDVITTGSTIESCVRLLHKYIPGVKVSVVGLALARN
jgi:competence protein ComFC